MNYISFTHVKISCMCQTIIFIFNLQNDLELQERDKPPSYQSTINPQAVEQTHRVVRGPLAPINNALNYLEKSICDFVTQQKRSVKIAAGIIFLILYTVYFAIAVSKDADRASDLIYVTVFAFICLAYWFIKKLFGKRIWKSILKPIGLAIATRKKYLIW